MTYSDYLKSHPIHLKPAPGSFDGPFSTFYTEYVEPNLPQPERVIQFNQLLELYCQNADTKFIIRQVGKLIRGETYTTDSGVKFTPSDNAPGWWLHALLMSDVTLCPDPTVLFQEMPAHMFKIPRVKTLNGAGFHLAHINDVKNGDTKWQLWDRSELIRRFTLNIHPCNWFLLSKTDFLKWGRNKVIISWIREKYRSRYGSLIGSIFDDQQTRAGVDAKQLGSDTYYTYGQQVVGHAVPIQTVSLGNLRIDDLVTKGINGPPVRESWRGRHIVLQITIGPSRFVLPHDELLKWAGDNTNALNTVSWNRDGHYYWSKPSTKMLGFLRAFERKD